MRSLTARAPTRIDFGGGWTDVPPYSDEEGGTVCNVAIARYATVRLSSVAGAGAGLATDHVAESALAAAAARRMHVADVAVELENDFPLGAGLGGSSAAGVAVAGALGAWRGDALDRSRIAELSRSVEVEDLGVAGGRQDHYAAAYGGLLALRFGADTRVERLPLSTELRCAIERRCIVVYTGHSRISGENITAVLDAYRAREPRVVGALARIKALAEAMIDALRRESLDDLGALVGEHWEHQRALHPAITTSTIDEILARSRQAGALGGKALGASGGGCVLVVAAEGGEEPVRAAIAPFAEPLPFTVDDAGLDWTAES